MSSPLRVDVLVVGGSLQGLLVLDRLMSEGYSCALLTTSDLGAGQTLHSHGVLNTGFGMFGPEPVNLLHQVVLPDLARRGVRTYGSWVALLPGRDSAMPLPEVNVDKVDLVSALARDRENVVIRGSISELERSDDGRLRRVVIEPAGVDLAPEAIVVAAGTGSKALLRQLGADARQVETIKHRPVHVLCVRGSSSELPPLDLVSPGDQFFVASHERDGVRKYLATPMQFQAPSTDEVAADASTEVDEAFAGRGWETFLRICPSLRSVPGLEFATYAGLRQDVGDTPGMPMCQTIEAVPNVVAALPSGLLGAWPVSLQVAALMRELATPTGPRPLPGGGVDVRLGREYDETAAVNWSASGLAAVR